jgi:hypothetical protein
LEFDRIGILILRLGRDKKGYGEGINLFSIAMRGKETEASVRHGLILYLNISEIAAKTWRDIVFQGDQRERKRLNPQETLGIKHNASIAYSVIVGREILNHPQRSR